MNILRKIIFLIKKPSIILLIGEKSFSLADMIFQILARNFKVRRIFDNSFPLAKDKNEILIFTPEPLDYKNIKIFKFLIKKSRQPILVFTNLREDLAFSQKQEALGNFYQLAKFLPCHGFIIDNFDRGLFSKIKNEISAYILTYGFQEEADFRASDINISGDEINFKVNYEGNIVPFWLKNIFGREQISIALIAACVGTIKGLNLVEISQAFRLYQSPTK